jgi:hypothetical protein
MLTKPCICVSRAQEQDPFGPGYDPAGQQLHKLQYEASRLADMCQDMQQQDHDRDSALQEVSKILAAVKQSTGVDAAGPTSTSTLEASTAEQAFRHDRMPPAAMSAMQQHVSPPAASHSRRESAHHEQSQPLRRSWPEASQPLRSSFNAPADADAPASTAGHRHLFLQLDGGMADEVSLEEVLKQAVLQRSAAEQLLHDDDASPGQSGWMPRPGQERSPTAACQLRAALLSSPDGSTTSNLERLSGDDDSADDPEAGISMHAADGTAVPSSRSQQAPATQHPNALAALLSMLHSSSSSNPGSETGSDIDMQTADADADADAPMSGRQLPTPAPGTLSSGGNASPASGAASSQSSLGLLLKQAGHAGGWQGLLEEEEMQREEAEAVMAELSAQAGMSEPTEQESSLESIAGSQPREGHSLDVSPRERAPQQEQQQQQDAAQMLQQEQEQEQEQQHVAKVLEEHAQQHDLQHGQVQQRELNASIQERLQLLRALQAEHGATSAQLASATIELEAVKAELRQLQQQSRQEAGKLAVLQQRRQQLEEQEQEQEQEQQVHWQHANAGTPGDAPAPERPRRRDASSQAGQAEDAVVPFPGPCASCTCYQRQLQALQEQVAQLQAQASAGLLETQQARQQGLASEAELLLVKQKLREVRHKGPDGKPLSMSGES